MKLLKYNNRKALLEITIKDYSTFFIIYVLKSCDLEMHQNSSTSGLHFTDPHSSKANRIKGNKSVA